MPNHFHLLVHEKLKAASASSCKNYSLLTQCILIKNERTGSLFSGLFKAIHANEDEYLKYLFSYIHLNPIKLIEPSWKDIGIADKKRANSFLKSYNYSSFLDFTEKQRKENIILDKKHFPEYFEDFKEFKNFIENWLTFSHVKVSP